MCPTSQPGSLQQWECASSLHYNASSAFVDPHSPAGQMLEGLAVGRDTLPAVCRQACLLASTQSAPVALESVCCRQCRGSAGLPGLVTNAAPGQHLPVARAERCKRLLMAFCPHLCPHLSCAQQWALAAHLAAHLAGGVQTSATLHGAACRASWRPLANTEVYVDMDPQQFNSEVRRRALEWRGEQEAAFHRKVRESSHHAARAGVYIQHCTAGSKASAAQMHGQLPNLRAKVFCGRHAVLCEQMHLKPRLLLHVSALPRHHAVP